MRPGATRREARIVVALLTGLIAGSAVGGGAVYLFGGKRAAKPDVAPANLAKADELALVPADAAAFVHFRAAETWKHPAFAEMKAIADKAGPDGVKTLDESFAPAPSTLDRVTIVLIQPVVAGQAGTFGRVPTPAGVDDVQPKTKGGKGGKGGQPGPAGPPQGKAAPPSPPSPPAAPETVVMLAYSAPFDANKVQLANVPGGSKRNAGGKEYWLDPTTDTALFFPPGQDKVLVVGSAKGVEAFILRSGKTEGPLAAALKLAAEGGRHVAGGLNLKDNPMIDSLRNAIPEEYRQPFGPLFRAEAITGSVIIGDKNTKLEVRLGYADAEAAKKAEGDLRTSAANGRKALEEPRKKLQESLRGTAERPRTFKDLPTAATAIFALGTLNLIDDLLKDPPLAVEGNEVVATVVLPSLAESSMASSGVMLGMMGFLFTPMTPFGPPPVAFPEPGPGGPGQPTIKKGAGVGGPPKDAGPLFDPPEAPKPKPKPEVKVESKPPEKPPEKLDLEPLADFGFTPPKK